MATAPVLQNLADSRSTSAMQCTNGAWNNLESDNGSDAGESDKEIDLFQTFDFIEVGHDAGQSQKQVNFSRTFDPFDSFDAVSFVAGSTTTDVIEALVSVNDSEGISGSEQPAPEANTLLYSEMPMCHNHWSAYDGSHGWAMQAVPEVVL